MSTELNQPRRSILWAIDPYEPEPCPSVIARWELDQWAARQSLEIIPVYVAPLSVGIWLRRTSMSLAKCEEKLNAYVNGAGLAHVREGRVVMAASSSRAEVVAELLRVAQEEGAAAIAICSHGRAGVGRVMLGSFAEGLLKRSPVPLLFMGRASGREESVGEHGAPVVFLTDFSEPSRVAFGLFLQAYKPVPTPFLLVHLLGMPLRCVDPELMYPADTYNAQSETWARVQGDSWIREANECGSYPTLVLKGRESDLLTGRKLLHVVNAMDARMIIMCSNSHPWERALFGSLACEVFRGGRTLTLMYGPQALAEHPPVRQPGASQDLGHSSPPRAS